VRHPCLSARGIGAYLCHPAEGGAVMADSFKTGDVVQLKSGGPRMTVNDVPASGSVLCNWFNREGDVWTPQHAGFKPDQLMEADQP
jgi:uncharacterized protein YodC (DUF2158 family)